MPVHPVLRDIRVEWVESGWMAYQGRAPESDDLLMPNQDGNP